MRKETPPRRRAGPRCAREIERDLARVFRRHGSRFAYLWGSRARGRSRPGSDWDLAVSLPAASGGGDLDRFLDLVNDLCVRLGTDEVDVTLIEDATPAVRFLVQHTGRLIHESDRSARIAFELRSRKEFWDLEVFLKPHIEGMWRRVRNGAFGK